MADIQSFPFLRHLRGSPTTFVQHIANGRVVHEGVGQSFWFRPLFAALSEIPVDDRDLPLHFHARTADFQDVVVQGSVTYRIADPARIARRIDFGIHPLTGRWREAPLEQVGGVLAERAQQSVVELVASTPMSEAVLDAVPRVRRQLEAELGGDAQLAEMGLEIVDVRVASIRPDRDLERALGTPARESVQQEADRATFERRAIAVENERAIAENELNTRIQLAAQEEELVARQGANERERVHHAAEASRTEAAGRADALRLVGEAEGDAERARVGAYRDLEPRILVGLALRELASNPPDVGSLTVTPDLLVEALANVAGRR